MAVFNMKGKFRLLRDHEDRNAPNAGSTAIDENAYDPRGGGGTTTLVVNPFTRELERDFISLNGTIVNCSGGQRRDAARGRERRAKKLSSLHFRVGQRHRSSVDRPDRNRAGRGHEDATSRA